MRSGVEKEQENGQWESVHICPNCERIINLAEIDLRAITTGIVVCPHCAWSGKIEIKIIDANFSKNVKPDG